MTARRLPQELKLYDRFIDPWWVQPVELRALPKPHHRDGAYLLTVISAPADGGPIEPGRQLRTIVVRDSVELCEQRWDAPDAHLESDYDDRSHLEEP